jgi:hypothetical protein
MMSSEGINARINIAYYYFFWNYNCFLPDLTGWLAEWLEWLDWLTD